MLHGVISSLVQQPVETIFGGVTPINVTLPNVQILNSRVEVQNLVLGKISHLVRNESIQGIPLPIIIHIDLIKL